MSNNPNDPNDPDNQPKEDTFESDRLPDIKEMKALRDSQKQKAESFTSFSEGTPALDKFKILGLTGEHSIVREQKLSRASHQSAETGSTPTDLKASTAPAVPAQGTIEETNSSPSPNQSATKLSIMRRPPKDESFTSFSDGLPAVDKFGIIDPDFDKVVLMPDYLATTRCSYLAPYADVTAGATSVTGGMKGLLTHSKSKSRTLDRLMFLTDSVPWGESVKVELSAKPQFIEYSFDEHSMVLDKSFGDEQTVLNFAHQAYHSTNRLLTKIYDEEKLDRESFIDLYMWSEVAALVTELNVRKELGITKVTPPKVLCQESSGSTYSVNVEELLKARGMKTLHDVLFHSMVRGTEDLSLVYVFDRLFDIYDKTYDSEIVIARSYIDFCLESGLERDCI